MPARDTKDSRCINGVGSSAFTSHVVLQPQVRCLTKSKICHCHRHDLPQYGADIKCQICLIKARADRRWIFTRFFSSLRADASMERD